MPFSIWLLRLRMWLKGCLQYFLLLRLRMWLAACTLQLNRISPDMRVPLERTCIALRLHGERSLRITATGYTLDHIPGYVKATRVLENAVDANQEACSI